VTDTPAGNGDGELAIALAEYTHIGELRNQLEQKSSTRFSFFLALSTAVTAVVAGLAAQGQPDTATTKAAAAVLGAMLLIFGVSIFLRQVAFSAYSRRLSAAEDAMRSYLAGRAPQLKPFLLLPVGADRGAFPARNTAMYGFAGAIAVLNSTIVGLVAQFMAGPVVAGAAVAFALALQFGHAGRSRRLCADQLEAVRRERGLTTA
jgi:hypothetical protein